MSRSSSRIWQQRYALGSKYEVWTALIWLITACKGRVINGSTICGKELRAESPSGYVFCGECHADNRYDGYFDDHCGCTEVNRGCMDVCDPHRRRINRGTWLWRSVRLTSVLLGLLDYVYCRRRQRWTVSTRGYAPGFIQYRDIESRMSSMSWLWLPSKNQ